VPLRLGEAVSILAIVCRRLNCQSWQVFAGLFRRNQSDIDGNLYPVVKAFGSSNHQLEGQCVSGPTLGWVISRRVTGRFSSASSRARVNSWISGVSWSSTSSRSWRRRLGPASQCSRLRFFAPGSGIGARVWGSRLFTPCSTHKFVSTPSTGIAMALVAQVV
jgi:hypothetical protein